MHNVCVSKGYEEVIPKGNVERGRGKKRTIIGALALARDLALVHKQPLGLCLLAIFRGFGAICTSPQKSNLAYGLPKLLG